MKIRVFSLCATFSVGVLAFSVVIAFANSAHFPACAPPEAALFGPKATLCKWSKEGASWSLEQTIQTFHANDEKEIAYARVMAEQTLNGAQLTKAARDKWGDNTEILIAKAIGTDTLADDEESVEQIDGDHATIKYKPDSQLVDLILVRINGQWKVDVAACIKNSGGKPEDSTKFMQECVRIIQSARRDLDAGKFKNGAQLAASLKTEFAKINAAQ